MGTIEEKLKAFKKETQVFQSRESLFGEEVQEYLELDAVQKA